MKKIVGISLFVFWAFTAAILFAGLVSSENNKNSLISSSVFPPGANNPAQAKQIALDTIEIAKHSSTSDCWIIIDSRVYDVTTYLKAHPGGAGSIATYCGKDASAAFAGLPHSSYASSLLSAYFVGALNQKIGGSQVAQNIVSPTSFQSEAIPPNNGRSPQRSPVPANKTTLNSAEIAKHNSKDNCWITINSKAYNVTSYLRAHPGGAGAILPYCGGDATQAFQGLPHSSYATDLLASYYIGALNQSTNTPQIQQNIQSTSISIPSASKSEDDDEYEDD